MKHNAFHHKLLFFVSVFIVVAFITNLHINLLRKKEGSHYSREQDFSNFWENKVLRVLIISSLPRSGSSLLASTIASFSLQSVYFFEPFYYERRCFDFGNCSSYLENTFACEITKGYTHALAQERKPNFIRDFSLKASRCLSKLFSSQKCFSRMSIQNECLESDLRVIKVIRLRLKEAEKLLEKSSYNLRIIHLVRDPRGSLFSMSQIPNWPLNLKQRCSAIAQDLSFYTSLAKKHPKNVIRVSFEDFSRNIWKTTLMLYKFINYPNLNSKTTQFGLDFDDLPQRTKVQLEKATPKTSRIFSKLERGSDLRRDFQDWRERISQQLITKSESDPNCRWSLNILNYQLLNTTNNAKNYSINLYK